MTEPLVRIKSISPTTGFKVSIVFTNGEEREVDLRPYLKGPMFEPLRTSRKLFRKMRLHAKRGTIVWPNGAELEPGELSESP